MIGLAIAKLRALAATIAVRADSLEQIVAQVERLHRIEHAARLQKLEEVYVVATMPNAAHKGMQRRSAWVVRVPVGGSSSFKFQSYTAGHVKLTVNGLYINLRVKVAGCDIGSCAEAASFDVETGNMVEVILESVVERPICESRL